MDFFRVNEYRKMMADDARMSAYKRAIEQVCPGKVVCEIGVGLGPLSLMALRAGASKVYGIELRKDILELARQVILANGFDGSRFVPLCGQSTDIALPERVDVIVSETLDFMGIGEKTVDYMRDGVERFLKTDGDIIPKRLVCYMALAHSQEFQSSLDFWGRDLVRKYGLDYREIGKRYLTSRAKCSIQAEELYSDWERWQDIDFAQPETFRELSVTTLRARRTGTVTGFCYAFDVQLAEEVTLSTLPGNDRTHWEQGFHSFPESISVSEGELFEIGIRYRPTNRPLRINYEIGVRRAPPNGR